jgi:hypothetical protein
MIVAPRENVRHGPCLSASPRRPLGSPWTDSRSPGIDLGQRNGLISVLEAGKWEATADSFKEMLILRRIRVSSSFRNNLAYPGPNN